jgi:hypothetical protein
MHVTIVRTDDEEARALTPHAEGGDWIQLEDRDRSQARDEMALLRAIWHRLRIQVGRTRPRRTNGGDMDTFVMRLPDQ